MSSTLQVAANRLNGLKGGVKTEQGKAISRMNARKHGLYATLMTQHDVSEIAGIAEELAEQFSPVGVIEEMLVEKLAATTLRMQRLNRIEQRHYSTWNETNLDGIKDRCERKLDTLGRHETRLTNQLLKLLRDLERRQKERRKIEDCGLKVEDCRVKEKAKNEPKLPQRARATGVSLAAGREGADHLSGGKNVQDSSDFSSISTMPCASPEAGHEALPNSPKNNCRPFGSFLAMHQARSRSRA